MKIALQYREQARRVYYGAVFKAKKEILVYTPPVPSLANSHSTLKLRRQ